MIKANELRIGNAIWDDTRNKVKWVNHRVISDLASHATPLPYSPIPLTPEWLERCGLELRKEDKIWQIQVGNTSYLEIEAEEPFMCGVTPETWRDICPIYIWNAIKHVHQLQNIYFALTGEELTIKQ